VHHAFIPSPKTLTYAVCSLKRSMRCAATECHQVFTPAASATKTAGGRYASNHERTSSSRAVALRAKVFAYVNMSHATVTPCKRGRRVMPVCWRRRASTLYAHVGVDVEMRAPVGNQSACRSAQIDGCLSKRKRVRLTKKSCVERERVAKKKACP